MAVIGGEELIALSTTSGILIVLGTVALFVVAIVVATWMGRRWGRRGISQRLTSLGSRLGLDPPEDESNIETALAYLEQVTGGAAQSVAESSSDAIRLRRSLDTLTQGVVLCDENGNVIYRNGRANALMVSRHGDALAAQAVTELLEGAWHEGIAERTLDLYGPPRRTLQVRARQIDDGRRPLGVIALIEDISERRRLEEIRRDFVANVSHELKTPIGALGLLAETLVAEPDAEVAQRLAGRIHNEAFRVSRIIDDLLDLSRIESEEAPSREPVLVNLVMADAIERVRSTADQRGIEIVLHEPSPPIAVVGERRQLVSAMHALLENAITYSYDDSKVVVTGTVRRGTALTGQTAVVLSESVEAAFTPETLGEEEPTRPDAPGASTLRRPRSPRAPPLPSPPRANRYWAASTTWPAATTYGARSATTCGSPSRTAASGSRPATSTEFSSGSTGSTTAAAATPAAPGWGSPSCATWPTTIRAGSTSNHARARVPPSASSSPSTRIASYEQAGNGQAGNEQAGHEQAGHQQVRADTPSQASVRAGGDGPIRVLLAEDEESFIDALVIGLTNEGFRVIVARDGAEALRLYDETEPDILLLDLMLPKMSGVDVCRAIRTRSRVPIIMVTAKGTEIDTVVALEMGADDYVTKPYRLRELVARMRAVLRRAPGGLDAVEQSATVDQDGEGVWEASGIKMDFDQRRAFVRGDEVHLRRKEFELLRLLVENSGRVLTRDVLIDRVWGTDYIGDTKTLDVHIKRLRSRIEADPSVPVLITTVRGVGYRFAAPTN